MRNALHRVLVWLLLSAVGSQAVAAPGMLACLHKAQQGAAALSADDAGRAAVHAAMASGHRHDGMASAPSDERGGPSAHCEGMQSHADDNSSGAHEPSSGCSACAACFGAAIPLSAVLPVFKPGAEGGFAAPSNLAPRPPAGGLDRPPRAVLA
jgi:hypothetical protein